MVTCSGVKVDFAPVDLLLVEEFRRLNGHEHVDAGEAHAKEGDGNHDTDEAARSQVFLNVHVVHDLVAIGRYGGGGLCSLLSLGLC